MPERYGAESLAEAIAGLSEICPGRWTTTIAVREHHAGTLTDLPRQPPDAVVYPETIGEVQAVVRLANRHRAPLIAFGAGTSLEGQVNAPRGGLSIDLSRMDRIVRISDSDLDVTIEPGVTLDNLNSALRDTGLFFPVDPGAGIATLGGMASTRASGTTTVRYGAMRENVLALKVVLADGTLVCTGSRARKSAAGYDLTRLFIGAEGTLGIIVELTLRLHPRPETVSAGIASFASIAAAASTSAAAVQAGLAMQRIELLDPPMLRIVNGATDANLPADGPALFVEVAGSPASVAEHMDAFMTLVRDQGGTWLRHATSEDDRRALWKARHDAFWSIRTAFPGRSFLVTDVCVPVSRLAECLEETVRDLEENGLTAPIVGHVGDGNFHTVLVYDAGDDQRPIKAYLDRLAARALRMEGTCTGEHGIGQGKAGYLAEEAGAGLAVMRQIKQALDPLGLMNPGKYV